MTLRPAAMAASVMVLAAAFVVAASAPVLAASSLTLEVGYGGFILPGRAFPVSVDATTDRLVRGHIEVTATTTNGPGQSVAVRMPVEVPGGGAKQFTVVIPAVPMFPGGSYEVEAALIDDETDSAVASSVPAIASLADDRELVGLLPAASATTSTTPTGRAPETVPLAIDAGVAQFFAIDAVLLGLAPASLDPLGTIVAAATDLRQLTPEALRGVHEWLGRGGTLIVDAPLGAPVDGLPEEWQPAAGSDGTAWAGSGRTRLVPGVLATGAWQGVVFPTPSRASVDPRFGGGFGFGPTSIGDSLAGDAGLRVPRLGWLLGFLLVYTAVVGPLLGFVLNRRKRAELAWVIVPLAAVVFAAGSYTAARGLRSGTRLAHGSVIELSPAGASATTFVGVAAQRRQTTDIGLGDRSWEAGRAASGFEQGPRGEVELTENGPTARLRLTAGQFAVASLRAPVASPGDLVLTATSSEDGIAEGTIRNELDTRLEEVLVLTGSGGVHIGQLAPGEERTWRADRGAGNRMNDPFQIAEVSLWERASGMFGRPDPDSPVNFPVWQAAGRRGGPGRPAGSATAVGWTRAVSLPIQVNGRARTSNGRTAITTTTPVVPQGRLTDMTSRGELLRGGFENFGGGPNATSLGRVVRFLLPTGAPPIRDLVASVPAFAGEVELWDGQRWVPAGGGVGPAIVGPESGVRIAPPVAPVAEGGPIAEVSVPRPAVVSGQVFLRFPQNAQPDFGSLLLRERS